MANPPHSSVVRRSPSLAVLGAGLFVFGAVAAWPSEASAGHVRGTVTDTKGAPVRNVIVTVWDLDTKGRKKMVSGRTDGTGRYDLTYPDDYREPGDAFGGGTFPDLHVTFEVQAVFSTKNFYRKAVEGTTTGPLVKVQDWPAQHGQMANWDPKLDLLVPPVLLPVDQWEMVRTTFDPRVHGFSWKNEDRNVCWGPTCKPPWNALFSTAQALCGGMSLTAFKHWADGKCDVASFALLEGAKFPAALKKEVVENQLETFFLPAYLSQPDAPGFEVISQILRNPISMLPVTTPGFRFFEWQAKGDFAGDQLGKSIGASTKAEWPKLYPELRDRHLPVVLGLINAKAPKLNWADVDIVNKNHQVLAIGYDHNPRFKSVTVYVYDPNYPKKVQELRFGYKLSHSQMHIEYSGNAKTRGWFVGTVAPSSVHPPKGKCSLPDFTKK